MGFSPSALFTLAGDLITISSTIRPQVLIATVWPPIGLPLPGLTTHEVTPPASASAKPRSAGLIASSARSRAPTGWVISLTSSPAQPSPSSHTPRCACASMKPGSTHLPVASTTSTPLPTRTFEPTAAILPSVTSTVAFSIGSPSTGTTYPPTIATLPAC